MSAAREQQYWLPGFGLSRHIVLGHIQYFLGPSASARPFTYQVMNGAPYHLVHVMSNLATGT